MTRPSRASSRAAWVLATLALAPTTAHADAPPPGAAAPGRPATDFEAQLAAKAPAIVSLKYLAIFDASSEYAATAHGVVVDPSGLVLLANEGNFVDASVKVRDIKVIVGSDPKEWGAILVARDTTLDLAWVQIVDLEGRTLAAIDLEKGRDPKLGEDLFGVTRAGRGFDYAPSLKRCYVTSRIESPRLVWDFDGEFRESGLPVFDAAGTPVAVIVAQHSAEGADEDGGSHDEVFLLPLSVASKSLAAAKRRVPDALAKAREAAKEAPKETPKDGEPKAPAMDDAPKPPEPSTPAR